jgi:hypothetical protein
MYFLMVVKQKKTNRISILLVFYNEWVYYSQNSIVSNRLIDGSSAKNQGIFLSGEAFHPQSGNIVLSGVPSKSKIKLFY